MDSHNNKAYLQNLPKKRMGSGCLIFNESGQVLLVKPTYKSVWEIPGGVVEANESPKAACQREVREELGLELNIGRLLCVDYNTKTAEKTESLMFIYDGGIITLSTIRSIRLPANELRTFRFFTPNTLPKQMTPSLRRRVLAAWSQADQEGAVYLENQNFI